MQKENKVYNGLEMNVPEIARFVVKRAWLVLLFTVAGMVVMYLISKKVMTPQYQSQAEVYILSQQEEQAMTNQDMELASELKQDYMKMTVSNAVLDRVIEELDLSMDYDQLVNCIEIEDVTDTRLIIIKASDKSAEQAQAIVDKVCEVASEQIETVMDTKAFHVLQSGTLSKTPYIPKVMKNMVMGGLVGMVCSMFIILLCYQMDDSIKRPEEIETELQLELLGVLPMENKRYVKKSKYYMQESYNAIRTKIVLSHEQKKIFTITSMRAMEGKTKITFELAQEIAKSGKKVLYIDTNLRQKGTTSPAYGLSEFLAGEIEVEKLITKSSDRKVDQIYAGKGCANASIALNSERFTQLLAVCRQCYDYVFMDTPAIGKVIDASIVAHESDGVIMVVSPNVVNAKRIHNVVTALSKMDVAIFGVIFNKINLSEYKESSYYCE